MKRIISLFIYFYVISFYAQNDTISLEKNLNFAAVSANKMNVVYRGFSNPISIAVQNCKSYTASGNGLYQNSDGTYQLLPTSGLETVIFIEIVLNDGTIKKEEYKFRIKNIPYLFGKINGLHCNQSILLMTKKELNNAEISIGFPNDFVYELNFYLKQFKVEINNKSIILFGSKFSKEVLDLINKLPINSTFKLKDFKSNINCDNCLKSEIHNVEIMIVSDDYYPN